MHVHFRGKMEETRLTHLHLGPGSIISHEKNQSRLELWRWALARRMRGRLAPSPLPGLWAPVAAALKALLANSWHDLFELSDSDSAM